MVQVELSWSYGNWIYNDKSVVFSRYLNFPQPIKLTATYIAEILLKVVLNTIKKKLLVEKAVVFGENHQPATNR